MFQIDGNRVSKRTKLKVKSNPYSVLLPQSINVKKILHHISRLGRKGNDREFCNNKQIIFISDKCNGVYDCLDRSDESDCSQFFKISSTHLPVSCIVDNLNNYNNHSTPEHKGFQCGPNKCIDINYFCNKNEFSSKFTKASSDILKSECESLLALVDNDVFCKNRTLWKNKQCNGKMIRCHGNIPGQCVENLSGVQLPRLESFNCADYSSENYTKRIPSCMDKSYHVECLASKCSLKNFLSCKDKNMCIHEALFCDGYNNCPNGFDEDKSFCEKCPKEFGHPFGNSKSATFSCHHRYTNKPICAVPCDGIDDMCKDYSDEICELEHLEKIAGLVLCLFILTIFVGECAIKIQEFILKRKLSTYNTRYFYIDLKTELLFIACQEKGHQITNHGKHLRLLVDEIFNEKMSNTKQNLVLLLIRTEMLIHCHSI